MSRKFNHLHVHSSFSLLDGVSKREDLIQKAKQFGMDALAMTEHGNIFNAISFYKECTDASVKPIIGQEFYVAPDNHLNRTYSKKSESEQEAKLGDLTYYAYHLTVLAKNRDGYESLKKLSSMAWKNGFYKKPRIDDELLAENKNGLIVLSGCLAGKIARLIVAGNKDKALDEINKQRSMFGEDFYLELMSHGISEDAVVNECLIDISKQYGIPLVLTGDSHFTEHGDEFSHEVALAIGTNKTIQDPDRFKFNGEGYWLKSGDEMEEVATAASIPMEALENTINISNRVDDYGFKLTSRKHKSIIPLFRDEHGEAYTNEVCHSLLEAKAWSGLVERGVGENEEYHKRLVVELELIKKKEFSSYFLIIADIVDFMRVKKMPIPVGRGSSLGSLLCYCLFITGLDPIQYTIPFSRFINEGRKDLPDIDTDISQERRKEVIEYIVNKYGKDRVAQIATFQSMAAKAAVDNVGRALGVPSTIRRSVGHLIGDTVKDDKIKDIIESNSKVRAIMEQTPEWIRVTERLEGNHRNMGAHAAGIVISNDPIMNHLPLVKDSTEGYLTTQYDMKDISELGLLKLDMLGLKTLDVIYQTLGLIKVRHNIELDFHKFPVNDAATYQTISNGKFVSMFQCDSSGMRSVAKQLQPEIFDHLIALNALYRPGPMLKVNGELSIMEHYIERRHNREEVDLWHPAFETVFKGTYGLPLYQEQVMAISQIIGRFNDTEADEYRAAIGKKDKVKFQAVQDKLVKRGIENGHTPEWMADLTAKLAGSARYNWNKGHSLAYSYISYVTAYLETHFALEYYTTLLNVNLGDADQLKVLLSAILQKGIKLLPPHINHSGEYFHTDGTVIYMGLYSVKQVGETTLPAIMDDRKKYGPYNGYIDFCIRMSPHGRVTKLHKENLAKAGAFSWDTSITDKEKVVNTELIQKIVKKFEGKVPPDEVYKYVIDKIVLNQEEYSASEKLSLERSVLNFYISSHPVMQYQPLFNLFPDVNFITPSQINEQMVGTKAIVLGVAEQRLMKQTKNGDPFMVLKLGDQLGNHQINIWSPLAQKAYAKTADDQVVLVCGTIREDKFRPGDNQLNVFSVVPVHSLGGLPITSFYSDDISVANRICTTLNAVPATVSDVVLNLGHAVILKDTSYIKPEHYLELSQYRVHYQLAI